MKLTKNLKIVAVLLGALPATLGTIQSAAAVNDPTAGRNREYQKCKDFSKRVLHAALTQSNGDRNKVDAAYRHYFGNIARCKARFL